MKVKVSTDRMKAAVNILKKGLGGGKILPITSYINMQAEGNTLLMTTTSLDAYTQVKVEAEIEEPGQFSIEGAKFISLVSKTTKKTISMVQMESKCKVKGNGTYTFEILFDEYPMFEFDKESAKHKTSLDISALNKALAINASCVATSLITPEITGYLVSERIITTDARKMCLNAADIKLPEAILMSKSSVNLISLMKGQADFYSDGEGAMIFETPEVLVFCMELHGRDTYPDVIAVQDTPFKYSAKYRTHELRAALERLMLFTAKDQKRIDLSFSEEQLSLSVGTGNTAEVIPNLDKGYLDFVAYLDADYLYDIVKSIPTETVTIWYGLEEMVKISCDKVDYFLSAYEN